MADKSPDRKLTPKQELFCQLYTKYWEATRAAKEAGYSEKSAGFQGYQLLQIPLVKSRIKELRDHALEEIGASRERVLLELTRLAYVDIAEAYDEIGQLKPIKEMPEHLRRAISKMKVFEQFDSGPGEKTLVGFVKEIELVGKKGALDSLAKILGFAPDKVEHSGPNGKPIEHRELSSVTDDQLNSKIQKLLAKSNSATGEK